MKLPTFVAKIKEWLQQTDILDFDELYQVYADFFHAGG